MNIRIDYDAHPDCNGKQVIFDETGKQLPNEIVVGRRITGVQFNSTGELWLTVKTDYELAHE